MSGLPLRIVEEIKASRLQQALLLVLLVFIVYRPALTGDFIWDDDLYLTRNPLIAAPDGLKQFWFSTQAMDYYPLSSSLLWVEWRLWGPQAPPYHAVNVALHALNAVLLAALLRRLLIPGAWLAAALFAVHPVAVEAAAWIAQTKSLLAMLFSVASVLAFLRAGDGRGRIWHLASLLLFAASLLSKTSQIALPAVLLVLAWWRRGRLNRADLLRSAPFFAMALAAGLVTIWFQDRHAIGDFEVHPEGPAARLAGAGWVVLFYLGKALAPVHLAAVYPRWHVDPSRLVHWIPLALALLLAAACFWIRIGGRRPLLAACACFVVLLAPVLGFLDIGFMHYSLVADHWQYGALPAVLAPLAAGVMAPGGLRTVAGRRAVLLIAACWLAVFAALAHERAQVFSSGRNLWLDNTAKEPGVGCGWSELGADLLAGGELTQARGALEQALAINSNDATALVNLGVLHARSGGTNEAITLLQRAVVLSPGDRAARVNLGIVLGNGGRHREAVAQFEAIARTSPRLVVADQQLAWLLATSSDDGVRDPGRALALMEPHVHGDAANAPGVLDTYAAALAAGGRYDEAIRQIETALRFASGSGVATLQARLDMYRSGMPWRTPSR